MADGRWSNSDIQINIKKALFFGYHGVNPEEKEHGQTFKIDITYFIGQKDFKDDLSNTVDYGDVVMSAENYFSSKRYNLIEQLASDLADHILLKFNKINKIEIKVTKSNPPIGAIVESASASCFKERI